MNVLFREIQRMLVDMKDKPSSFVGSKEWIGAIEIQMCLDKLYGVGTRTVLIILRVTLSNHVFPTSSLARFCESAQVASLPIRDRSSLTILIHKAHR